MTESPVHALRPGLMPFPQNVWGADQPWLADHFLPLLSIDQGLLRPALQGAVAHTLNPINPFDGVAGEGAAHNGYTCENWLAFGLDAASRYHFLGNPQFFRTTGRPLDADEQPYTQQMRSSYTQAQACFARHGRLASCSRYGPGELREHPRLNQLGGACNWANWRGFGVLPAFGWRTRAGALNATATEGCVPLLHQRPPCARGQRGRLQLVHHRGRAHRAAVRTAQPHCRLHT